MKRFPAMVLVALSGLLAGVGVGESEEAGAKFNAERDLSSLHYDHAPDRDDGQSAAADRTILESMYGADVLGERTIAVSGAYGTNKKSFDSRSDAVMDAVFGAGRWIAAHADWDKAVRGVCERWAKVLAAGGDVWVKEGGQSAITAAVLRAIHQQHPDVDTARRVHVVQHSGWNEKLTTPEALEFTRNHAHYIRIKDANRYLNKKGGDEAFETAALAHRTFGASWKAAFEYYPPRDRLDFSDTGELMHILGLGEMNIDALRQRFLEDKAADTGGN